MLKEVTSCRLSAARAAYTIKNNKRRRWGILNSSSFAGSASHESWAEGVQTYRGNATLVFSLSIGFFSILFGSFDVVFINTALYMQLFDYNLN